MTGEKFTLMQYSVSAVLGLIEAEDFVYTRNSAPLCLETKPSTGFN